MTVEHLSRSSRQLVNGHFVRSPHRTVARYELELGKQQSRLRQALLREEDLRHQNDELVQQQQVLRTLLAARADAADCVAHLTPRQHQIMELVLAGHPSKNIAADLGVSQRTVENHRAAIMKKTGSKSLPALARVALAAAWNGAGEGFIQPLARLALGAAWNGAGKPRTCPEPSDTARGEQPIGEISARGRLAWSSGEPPRAAGRRCRAKTRFTARKSDICAQPIGDRGIRR